MKFLTGKKGRSFQKFLVILPFMALVFTFSYFPLFGWAYTFFDYQPPLPLTMKDWVGLHWFSYLFGNSVRIKYLLGVLQNTFAISGLGILFSWLPMAFAIFLNEIKRIRYKKFIQTVTTLPNFISWVLVFSIAFSLFSTNGMVNNLLSGIGAINEMGRIQFLEIKNPLIVYFSMWMWYTWKALGWAAIMYIASIAGIDETLFEAARVDGAKRIQVIWHITIPSLLPTYFVLLLLQVASFLNNGMEQYYVFQNSSIRESIQVLDLYVYNLISNGSSYSLSAGISMMKSIISVALLGVVNGLSKSIRGESIV
jgi:putative aldouronate transport system permease protein